VEDLPDRLPLLRRVLEESLRLYPPVPRLDRQAVAADNLDGHEIAAGDFISIWPWLVHRHKGLWEEPDAFDTSRFTSANSRHRFQYIPFGGGPRSCIGARFAMAEALTILSHWISRWRLSPHPGRVVRPSGTVTLRPAGGLLLLVSMR
jgi:cytochrome P450